MKLLYHINFHLPDQISFPNLLQLLDIYLDKITLIAIFTHPKTIIFKFFSFATFLKNLIRAPLETMILLKFKTKTCNIM